MLFPCGCSSVSTVCLAETSLVDDWLLPLLLMNWQMPHWQKSPTPLLAGRLELVDVVHLVPPGLQAAPRSTAGLPPDNIATYLGYCLSYST